MSAQPGGGGAGEPGEGSGDAAGSGGGAFPAVATKMDLVQDILDRNRSILHQIRVNHEAQRPEGLSRNFLLIKEVNSNIDEVMGMYGSISDDFVTFMAQRPGSGSAADQQGGSSFGADADGANGATQPPAAAAPEAPAPAGAVAS